MALPATFDTATLTRRYITLSGVPMSGTVTATIVGADFLQSLETLDVIVPVSQTATLDADGRFVMTVPVTDDPDVAPTFGYAITELLTAPGGEQVRRTYTVAVPVGLSGQTINLAALNPVVAGELGGTTALTSTTGDLRYVRQDPDTGDLIGVDGQPVEVGTDLEAGTAGRAVLAAETVTAAQDAIALAAFVQTAVAALVTNAPAALNTLGELADALGDNPNLASDLLAAIALKADATHGHTAAQITDATTLGRVLLQASSLAAARDAISVPARATTKYIRLYTGSAWPARPSAAEYPAGMVEAISTPFVGAPAPTGALVGDAWEAAE